MAVTAGTVIATMVAETSRFVRPMQDASKQLGTFERIQQTANRRLEDFQRVGKRAGLAFGALAASLTLTMRQAGIFADQIDKMSIRTGIAREELQELQFVSGILGVEFDSIQRATTRLGQRLVESEGRVNETSEAIERLGIELRDANGQVRSMPDLFSSTVSALARMENEVERNALAFRLFGRRGEELIPLFDAGEGAIEELTRQARTMGLVMGDQAIRDLTAFHDEVFIVGQQIAFASRRIAADFLPAIRVIIEWIQRGIGVFVNLDERVRRLIVGVVLATGALFGLVAGLALTIKIFGIVAGSITTVIGSLRTLIGVLTTVGKTILAVLTPKLLVIGAIIGAIGLLYLAWRNNWFGIRDVVTSVWENSIKPVVDAIVEFGGRTLLTVWNFSVGAIGGFLLWLKEIAWPFIGGAFFTVWNFTEGTVSGFIEWVKQTAWPFIRGAFLTAWNFTLGVVDSFILWIRNTAWPYVRGSFSTAWNFTLGTVSDFINWIRQTAWPFIGGAFTTAWNVTANIPDFLIWLKETAWSLIDGAVSTAWDFTSTGLGRIITRLEDIWTWVQRIIQGAREMWQGIGQRAIGLIPEPVRAGAKGVANLWEGLMGRFSWQRGGFTGWGSPNEIAGFVHRREAVIPWDALRNGIAGVLDFLGMSGFQEGRAPTGAGLAGLDLGGLGDLFAGMIEGMGEMFQTIISEFNRLVDALMGTSSASEEQTEQTKQATQQVSAFQQALQMVEGPVRALGQSFRDQLPMVQVATTAFTEAGGGIQGVVSAFFALMGESETFRRLLDMANQILGSLVNAIGMVLEPFLAVFQVLQTALMPIFEALGLVLMQALEPAFVALVPILSMVGQALIFFLRWIGEIRLAGLRAIGELAEGIGRIPWVDTSAVVTFLNRQIQQTEASLTSLEEAQSALGEMTYEVARQKAMEAEQIERVNSELRRVPSGFRIALSRFQASVPRSGPIPAFAAATPNPPQTSNGGDTYIIFEGDVYGLDEFDRKVRQAVKNGDRRAVEARFGLTTTRTVRG